MKQYISQRDAIIAYLCYNKFLDISQYTRRPPYQVLISSISLSAILFLCTIYTYLQMVDLIAPMRAFQYWHLYQEYLITEEKRFQPFLRSYAESNILVNYGTRNVNDVDCSDIYIYVFLYSVLFHWARSVCATLASGDLWLS